MNGGHNNRASAAHTIQYDISGKQDPTLVATEAALGSTYRKLSAPAGFYIKEDGGKTTNWTRLTGNDDNDQIPLSIEQLLEAYSYDLVTGSYGASHFLNDTTPSEVNQVILKLSVAAPVLGNITVEIREVDGSLIPTGVILGTSTAKNAVILTATPTEIAFDFPVPANLDADTNYSIVLKNTSNGTIAIKRKDINNFLFASSPYTTWFGTLDGQMYSKVKGVTTPAIVVPSSGIKGYSDSVNWYDYGTPPATEYDNQVYYANTGAGVVLTTHISVPRSYVPGSGPVSMKMLAYPPYTSGGYSQLKATSTLFKAGVDALGSPINQLNGPSNEAEDIGLTPKTFTMEIIDSNGEINGVAVSPGDLIRIDVEKISCTINSEGFTQVSMIQNSTEISW